MPDDKKPDLRDVYVLKDIGGEGLDDLRAKFPRAVETLADELSQASALEPGDPVFDRDEFVVIDGKLRYRMRTDPPGSGPPERTWDPDSGEWTSA